MTRSGSRGKRKLAVGVLLLAVGTFGLSAVHAADIAIGYLQLQDDRRYAKKRNFARFLMQALGNPVEGAKVALKEVKFIGKTVGVEFELKHVERQDAAGLVAAVKEMVAGDSRYFLIDAPADVVAEVAKATRGQDVLLFNVSARDDGLRQEQCQSHLLHVIPNYGMLTDAFAAAGSGPPLTCDSLTPTERIDYAFAQGALRPESAVVQRHGRLAPRPGDPDGFALSDHLPLLAVFVFE